MRIFLHAMSVDCIHPSPSVQLKYGLAFEKTRNKPSACVPNKQSGNYMMVKFSMNVEV